MTGGLAGVLDGDAVVGAVFENGVAGNVERLVVATDKDGGKVSLLWSGAALVRDCGEGCVAEYPGGSSSRVCSDCPSAIPVCRKADQRVERGGLCTIIMKRM